MALWIIFYGFVQAWAPSYSKIYSMQFLSKARVLDLRAHSSPLLLALALWILGLFSNQILMLTVIIGLLILGGAFRYKFKSTLFFSALHFTSTERASL